MTNKGIITLVIVLAVIVIAGVGVWWYAQSPAGTSYDQTANTTQQNNGTAGQNTQQVQGNMVFGIKDATASMGTVTSVMVQVTGVQMHSQTNGWVTVSDQTSQYDLLKLKQSGTTALLAKASVPADTYDQLRLTINSVTVTANGTVKEAKLPSGELKIVGNVTVNAQNTSTATFDFMTDKSLHQTGNGQFIFAPVIKLEARSNANADVNANNELTVTGGSVQTSGNFGMDISGQVKPNFVLDAKTKIDVVNNILKVTTTTPETGIKVTSDAAMNAATGGGYLDTVVAVQLATQNGKKVWQVDGLKNLQLTTVYVDAQTGTVVTAQ